MNRDQLLEILRSRAELRDRDYKGPMAWDEDGKQACCCLVKDILAFANSGGGWLIVGVDDKTRDIVGLTTEQVQSFDVTRVSQFVNRYVAPSIDLAVYPLTEAEGTCILIRVAPFPTTPHICQKDFPGVLERGAIYVRTANKETARVTDPQDMSAVIERAVRNRADTLLREIEQVLRSGRGEGTAPSHERQFDEQASGALNRFWDVLRDRRLAPPENAGWADVICHPTEFRPERFQHADLLGVSQTAAVNFSGWPLPYVSGRRDETYRIQDGIETLAVGNFLYDALDFWQLRASGLFFYRCRLAEDTHAEAAKYGRPILWVERTLHEIADAVTFLGNLYTALGLDPDEAVTLHFAISGCSGRQLRLASPDRILHDSYVCQVGRVQTTRSLTVPNWKASRTRVCVEMAQEVLRLFNCEVIGDEQLAKDAEAYLSRRR
jgi:hypothetical protein